MRKIAPKADLLIDFEQQIRQVDVGDAPADLCFQSLHTFGEVITVILRHDQLAILDTDAIASVQLTVHTREQISQFLCAVAQTGCTGGVEIELLADVGAELRPDCAGNEERLEVGIPATVRELEVPGTQPIAEGRKRTELIGPPRGLAVRHNKPAPGVRDKAIMTISMLPSHGPD